MSQDEKDGRTEAIRLHKLAKRERFDELESAWAEAVENNSVEPGDLLFVLESAAGTADPELVDSMLWFLLSQRAEDSGAGEAAALARRAADVFPENKLLRDELAALYRAAHGDRPEVDLLLERTVGRADLLLSEAAEQLDKLLTLRPGTFVVEPGSEEPGRVAGFDLDAGGFEVEFADEGRTVSPEAALELEPLAPDDFRVRVTYDPDTLTELAEEDPGELVTEVLRAFGPRLTFRQMKSRLANVVPPGEWRGWWSASRPHIERAAWVRMADGSQPRFELRSRPLTYADRLRAHFNTAASPLEKLAMVADYLDETGGQVDASGDTLAFFASRIKRAEPEWSERDPTAGLAAAAVLSELHRRHPDGAPEPDTDPAAVVDAVEDRSALLTPVEHAGLARRIVEYLRAALGDARPEVLAELLPGSPVAGCEAIASALADAGRPELLAGPIDEVLARPDRYPAALAWLWRAAADTEPPAPVSEVDRGAIALGLFSAASALGRQGRGDDDRGRRLLGEVRRAAGFRGFGPLDEVLAELDDRRAEQVKRRIERHTGLSDTAVSHIHRTLLKTHPELFVHHVDPWEEDAVYTTESGLRSQREALSRLVSEELPAASRAVGKAAEMGDLSENAEWSAAVEARDRLAGRIERLQAQIDKAKIISREMAESDAVTIGTTVEVRDADSGEQREFTFLGPWDVDHARHVYSYRAGFGRAFMGRKVGDQVTVEGEEGRRTWEITAVSPGI